jgi:hypothetical protein
MPIEGIIDGLEWMVDKYSTDSVLSGYVKDAIEALQNVDELLDNAYQSGKDAMKEEIIEALRGDEQ